MRTIGPYGRIGRKARTRSRNMCAPCGNVDCDPMWPNTPAKVKILRRNQAGLCPGCGHRPCTCKHKGDGSR